MNLADWSAKDLQGLDMFYRKGCVWTIQEMKNRSSVVARSARDWIELSLPPRQHPLILPRIPESKHVIWYAIAFNEKQAEQLRGDLMAFVGSAGTTFDGRCIHLRKSDEAESALLDWIGGQWAFRLPVYPSHNKEVRLALERMRRIWALKPELKSRLLRTTEALIREFFLSLANGNELNSGHILKELKESGRLSAENVVFLEIEKLAAFERWGAIATHSQLSFLTMMQRPRHVTTLLVKALWENELSSYADAGDVEGILNYYRADFKSRYHGLLKSPGSSSHESVLMTFLLAAVGDETPRFEQIPKLLNRLERSPFFEFAKSLAQHAKLPVGSREDITRSPIERARQAFQRDDFDTAWDELLAEDSTVECLRLMLDCVEEFDSPESALIVQQRFEKLDQQSQELVLSNKRYKRLWEFVEKLSENGVEELPSDWNGWIEALDTGSLGSDCLLKLARESVDWDTEEYLNSPDRVRKLVTALSGCRPEVQHVLHLSFPHLISFFLNNGVGTREYLAIYLALLDVLVLGESLSNEDWNTTETLVAACLDSGLTKSQYDDLIENLITLWKEYRSIAHLDWSLDVLDLLAVHPRQNTDRLIQFYYAVFNTVKSDSRRVKSCQWELFGLLSSDFDQSTDFNGLRPEQSVTESNENGFDLSGKLIAIYTLAESAGSRAKSVILGMFPNVKVRLSHDLGGTDPLKKLARDADYFIVASRSATHAAYYFIKDNRGRDKSEIIYPAGKGSSSIVSALLSALES